MKKLLSIVLVCIFLALALASCGGCAHNFSDYRYTESGHYAVCILCGEAEGAEVPHALDEEGTCACGYTAPTFGCTHDFSDYDYDEGAHRVICALCGEGNGEEALHALNENGVCVCGFISPLLLTPIEGEISLSKPIVNQYLAAARAAYRTSAYADYKSSVVGNYATNAANMNDTPLPVTLSWALNTDGDATYTVTLATDKALTQNVRTYQTDGETLDVYNLFAGTTYYYQVKAVTESGESLVSSVATFQTAEGVRWINADGVRNFRDIGGWTGLNQGLVYRGSELNKTQSYGTAITEAGVLAVRRDLGIKTHLDLRPADFGTSSPLGEGVTWQSHQLSAFLSAFNSGNAYTTALKVFTDYDNYPVYVNCVGGADRTGTVIFMLEGLCGVDEADLSVDLELTSFSKFDYRYRYDNSTYVFASVVERVKQYAGATLQEKFASVFREVYGLSEAEISNIQAIMTQSGAVYDFAEGENGDILPEELADGSFAFSFHMRSSSTVSSVTVSGISLDFSFDRDTSRLTVYTQALMDGDLLSGIGTILFDDGATLRFYIETPSASVKVAEVVGGNYGKLFVGAEATTEGHTVTLVHNGSFEMTSSMAEALSHAGYERISLTLPMGMTVALYDKSGALLSQTTYTAETEIKLPLGGRAVFSASGQVTIKDIWLETQGASWADEVMAGDYKSFFGTGTNGMSGDGMALLYPGKANFIVSASTLQRLVALGYTYITFTVDADFADGTEGCYVVVKHGTKRYEQSFVGLSATDGRVKASVTVLIDETQDLQIITRTCALHEDGTVNMSNRVEALPESFVISGVLFARSGTEGVTDLKDTIPPEPTPDPTPDPEPDPDPTPDPEPDPEPDPANELALRIVNGEIALLVSTDKYYYTVEGGTVTTKNNLWYLELSNEALEALRLAGYTKLTFTMSAECHLGGEENLKRIVCRWRGTDWVSSPNKNDLGAPATSGETKTVTFDLTSATCGSADKLFIRIEVQALTGGDNLYTLTLTDFVFE